MHDTHNSEITLSLMHSQSVDQILCQLANLLLIIATSHVAQSCYSIIVTKKDTKQSRTVMRILTNRWKHSLIINAPPSNRLTTQLVVFKHLTINSAQWHASSTLSCIVLVDVGMTALNFGHRLHWSSESDCKSWKHGRRCELENENDSKLTLSCCLFPFIDIALHVKCCVWCLLYTAVCRSLELIWWRRPNEIISK